MAEWLVLKGKTLKRPAMTEKSAPPSCKPQTNAEDADEAQPKVVTVSEAEQSEVPQRKPAFSNSPSHILNTTLDLLDNSDTELPTEPEVRMESVLQLNIYTAYVHVVNSPSVYGVYLTHTVVSKHYM